jgi:hypothetical protein
MKDDQTDGNVGEYCLGSLTATKGLFLLLYTMMGVGESRYFFDRESDLPRVQTERVECQTALMNMIEAAMMYHRIVSKDPNKWNGNPKTVLLVASVIIIVLCASQEGFGTKPLLTLVTTTLRIESTKLVWDFMFDEVLQHYRNETRTTDIGRTIETLLVNLSKSRSLLLEWKGITRLSYLRRECIIEAVLEPTLLERYQKIDLSTLSPVSEATMNEALEGLLWNITFGKGFASTKHVFLETLDLFASSREKLESNWTELFRFLILSTTRVDRVGLEQIEQEVMYGVAPFQLCQRSQSATTSSRESSK